MAASEQTNITSFLSNEEVICDLSEKATKIALQYFEWRFATFVYLNSTLCLGAEVFLRSYSKAVITGKGTFYSKFVRKTRQYVLFGNGIAEIVHTLEWMRGNDFDNTGKYIIVCHSLDISGCDEADAIKMLWEYKITNVILLKSLGNKATGFTYFPLSNKACTYDEPLRLENLTSCLDALDFEESCNLFPMKLSNLNACPLIVSTFEQLPYMIIENGEPSGYDGEMLRLIAEKLNANLTLITPRFGTDWGRIEKNGSWSGSLADVYYEYANFSITSAALTLTRFTQFQISTDYNSLNLVWLSHPAKKIPSSLKLTYPFQFDAQIALIISCVIVVVSSLIIRTRFWFRVCRIIKLDVPRGSVLFYSWMICMGLGVPTTKLPSKSALLCVVFLWIWYCVLVRTFYQVSLIDAMKNNHFYPEFQTLEDVLDAQYPFGGGVVLKDYYMDYPDVYNNWIDVRTPDIIPTLRNLSRGMEFVLTMSVESAKTWIWKEKIHVHILSQRVLSCPTVIFFKKYSPLADPVNSILHRLTASGFSDKRYRDYATTKVKSNSKNSAEAIRLEHYTGCYVILIAGWVTSCLLFIVEIVFHKI